jgi:hypothetical protein
MESVVPVSNLFCPEQIICQDVPDAGALSQPKPKPKFNSVKEIFMETKGYKIPAFRAKKYNILPKESASTGSVKSLSQASWISSFRHIPMNILLNNTLLSVPTINPTTSYPCSPYMIVMMHNKHQVIDFTDEYTRKKAKYLWMKSKFDQIQTPRTNNLVKINNINKRRKEDNEKELTAVACTLQRLGKQIRIHRPVDQIKPTIQKKKRGWPKGKPRGPRHNILSNK